jgi:hypothetical protein
MIHGIAMADAGAGLGPRFEHDCSSCWFIGHLNVDGKDYDVWYHTRQRQNGHVIARYGVDGDYQSFDYKICVGLTPGSVLYTAAKMVDFGNEVIDHG